MCAVKIHLTNSKQKLDFQKIICPDHEPEIFLKNHSLCHEHSPPKDRLNVT